jgi:hypothetical protein
MIGGCRLAGATHRAATGREWRARLSHRDQACKIGTSRIVVAANLRWCSRKVSHRRAASFRSRLCGRRRQRCRTPPQTARVFPPSAFWVKIWLKKPDFTVRYHVNDYGHVYSVEEKLQISLLARQVCQEVTNAQLPKTPASRTSWTRTRPWPSAWTWT